MVRRQEYRPWWTKKTASQTSRSAGDGMTYMPSGQWPVFRMDAYSSETVVRVIAEVVASALGDRTGAEEEEGKRECSLALVGAERSVVGEATRLIPSMAGTGERCQRPERLYAGCHRRPLPSNHLPPMSRGRRGETRVGLRKRSNYTRCRPAHRNARPWWNCDMESLGVSLLLRGSTNTAYKPAVYRPLHRILPPTAPPPTATLLGTKILTL